MAVLISSLILSRAGRMHMVIKMLDLEMTQALYAHMNNKRKKKRYWIWVATMGAKTGRCHQSYSKEYTRSLTLGILRSQILPPATLRS
jgi:hypothetical protein